MPTKYRRNHYVPVWYQKRFIPYGQTNKELYYLDLTPPQYKDGERISHVQTGIHHWGPRQCFWEQDLYTTFLGAEALTEIEQSFFGQVDQAGLNGVDYVTKCEHPSVDKEAFNGMMLYLSTQKLRTPKGLGWLRDQAPDANHDDILNLMVRLQKLYSAIWMECVWLIADASQSDTKFIISDHPVTVYNRKCDLNSDLCSGNNDPDTWLQGTHTIFPLSLDKVLILTNLSWVRNPYQSELAVRPNPNRFRGAVFRFLDVQVQRHLSEQEVREINFIIKSRAHRYIAAGKEEWLYPENHVSQTNWSSFGDGYLLMPDPRPIALGGEMFLGYEGGRVDAFDAYGRKPWQKGYKREQDEGIEELSLARFMGEFARLYGPNRRGRSYTFSHLDSETDDAEYHQFHLKSEKRGRLKMEQKARDEMRRIRASQTVHPRHP